ncbi:uncharacterized protein [Triticum aestivum]|uniref:uncharacterized protein isoform X1 n=1 Tax=Triticum aestivum TaxID=4565 RepID=UPI001D035968|nr:uncharacterized protein LOC123141515 isoform X1 [Triticum aestivum]
MQRVVSRPRRSRQAMELQCNTLVANAELQCSGHGDVRRRRSCSATRRWAGRSCTAAGMVLHAGVRGGAAVQRAWWCAPAAELQCNGQSADEEGAAAAVQLVVLADRMVRQRRIRRYSDSTACTSRGSSLAQVRSSIKASHLFGWVTQDTFKTHY